jgi:acyl-CoA synthetase (AMP-forming)/AMP-acid ligase II
MIIRGGENISPSQVESILTAHPDVVQAVVVGLKDARLGQRVAAALTTRNGLPFDLEDCHRWCAEQGLSRFKWPEVIHRVEAIPLLGSGKADLVAVRELLEQSSGASSQTS